MTDKQDKQIIIDKIDVNGCECIIEDYQRANNFEGKYKHIKNVCELGERGAEYYNLFCKDNPNCYYKQLKRKEQECEYWKHQAELGVDTTDRLTKELEEKEQECERWQAELADKASELQFIEEKIKPLMKRPDDLDCYDLEWIVLAFADEFKQLKAENDLFRTCHDNEQAKRRKLEQTLTELEEIAQYDIYTSHTDLCIKLNWVKKKISEVLNDK